MQTIIGVRQHPHSITEVPDDGTTQYLLERRGYTTVAVQHNERERIKLPLPKERYILKRWDSEEQRMYFWQVPWVRKDEDGKLHQTGGWVTASRYATIYGDPETAERVALLRANGGQVDGARF